MSTLFGEGKPKAANGKRAAARDTSGVDQKAKVAKRFLQSQHAFGPCPKRQSENFIMSGKEAYMIPNSHMATLGCERPKNSTGAELQRCLESAKAKIDKKILRNIAAGHEKDPLRGREFHGHMVDGEYTKWTSEEEFASPAETRRVVFSSGDANDPLSPDSEKVVAVVKPDTLFSIADVLAKNIGYLALCKHRVPLFMRYFFGKRHDPLTNRPTPIVKPEDPEISSKELQKATAEGNTAAVAELEKSIESQKLVASEFEQQRTAFEHAARAVYFVSPVEIEPITGPNGEFYPAGSIELARHDEEVKPMSDEYVRAKLGLAEDYDMTQLAPQPVIFTGFMSDKWEGAPAVSVGTPVDRQRLWVVPPQAIEKIKQYLHGVQLNHSFPALMSIPKSRESSLLNFASLRTAYETMFKQENGSMPQPSMDELGNQQFDTEWLSEAAKLPFSRVWLSFKPPHLTGKMAEIGPDVLLPLRHGNVLDRMTSHWRAPDHAFDKKHNDQAPRLAMRLTVLDKTQGITSTHKVGREADEAARKNLEASVDQANAAAKAEKARADRLHKKCDDLTAKNFKLEQELAQLSNSSHIVLSRGENGVVDMLSQDCRVMMRCQEHGKMYITNVNGSSETLITGTFAEVRFASQTARPLPAFGVVGGTKPLDDDVEMVED